MNPQPKHKEHEDKEIYTGCDGVRAIVAKQFNVKDEECDQFLMRLYVVPKDKLAMFKSRLWRHPELRYMIN